MQEQYLNSVNLNGQTDFPYLCLDVKRGNSIPEPPGFRVMHWHEDFQFIYVLCGEIHLHMLEQTITVPAGTGVFLNQNVIHLVLASPDCHYKSFLFPELLVSFYPGCPAASHVKRIAGCGQHPFSPLDPAVDWQQRILEGLKALSGIDPKDPFYPDKVLVQLCTLWLELAQHLNIPEAPQSSVTLRRMRRFLHYIELHYSEDISLAQLAKSADVSKSECLRCFQASMGNTPYRYLIEYRLQKAMGLLTGSALSVGEIAQAVGFHSQSHFGRLFKTRTGYAPKDYRKSNEQKRP